MEGSSGGISVALILSAALESAVQIPITVLPGSTAAVGDYSGVPTAVSFAQGETSARFQVQATLDTEDEDVEEVVLGLGSLPDGFTTGDISQATVSIYDALRVSFAASEYSATEGGDDAVVTVQFEGSLPPNQTGATTIPLTAEGGEGADSSDWSGVPEELAFSPGDTSTDFVVTAFDDSVEDDGEMVKLGFGDLPEGVIKVAPETATVTLMNDDVGQVQEQEQPQSPTSDSCDTAVWCATLELVHPRRAGGAVWNGFRPLKTPGSSLSDDDFTYKDTEYRIGSIGSRPMRMFPSTSRFEIHFDYRDGFFSPREDHVREWTLHVGDELELPFAPERDYLGNQHLWQWRHPEFYNFRPGTTVELRIEASENRKTAEGYLESNPPTAPRYLFVVPMTVPAHSDNPDNWMLQVLWEEPSFDGYEDIIVNSTNVTKYKIQWKEKDGSWDNPDDVMETYQEGYKNQSDDSSGTSQWLTYLHSLSPDTEYAVRVSARNEFGYGPPSAEVIVKTRETGPPELATATVDGPTLTLTYDEALDEASVPASDNFKVTVGGGRREVSSVSVAGSAVTLNLESAVTSEDEVAVDYDKPVYTDDVLSYSDIFTTYEYVPRIRDVAGNNAASFSGQPVTNNTPATSNSTPAARRNIPASGAPGISGTPRVGETLTATTSQIADEDGLSNASFAYQWIRQALGGNTATDIEGATDATYTVTDADAGKAIKVRVTFTDDAGNEETLVSHAVLVSAVESQAPGPPLNLDVSLHDTGALNVSWEAPASDGGSAVTGYKVQWKEADGSWDTPEDLSEAVVTGTAHTITGLTDGVEYTVRVKAVNEAGDGAASAEETGTPRETTPPELSAATVDGARLTLTYNEPLDSDSGPASSAFEVTVGDATRAVAGVSVEGSAATLTLASPVTPEDTVTVSYTAPADEAVSRIRDAAGNAAASFSGHTVTNNTEEGATGEAETTEAENTAATGQPTISGTAQVGKTLTADVSGIDDVDGLANASFSYQWVRNDGGTETAIENATNSTYTLTDSDEGKTIKVRVSFTDDTGNPESLTSVATAAVAARPNTPATGQPTIGGTVQVGKTLTADVSDIDDVDGVANASFSYQWVRQDGGTETAIQDATDSAYTLTDADEGRTIKVWVNFTDDEGNLESLTSAATAAVAARPNTPATGQPTISGTAQVGETLTADVSDIDDVDGRPTPSSATSGSGMTVARRRT